MALVRFKNSFPSFLDEFFSGDVLSNSKGAFFGNSLPAINIKENEGDFQLEVAAPGMKKEDFKIELENNVLGISSEIQEENVEENERYTRREFQYSSFNRSFTLPENVDAEKIVANYKDGVLNIEIPKVKKEGKVSKLIDIS